MEVEVRVRLARGLSEWCEEQRNSGCRNEAEMASVSHEASLLGGELELQLESLREVGELELRV